MKSSAHIIFYISSFYGYLFWPKHNKCLKMGAKCPIFASFRTRLTIFSNLKRIMMVREIPRNGFIWLAEIAPHKAYYNSKRNSKKWGRSVH